MPSNGKGYSRGGRARERKEKVGKMNSEVERGTVTLASGEVVSRNKLRGRICEYMRMSPRPSDAQVATLLGCARSTVFRVRRLLETSGVEAAVVADGRYRSGKASDFGPAWLRLLELKTQYPSWGGYKIWHHMMVEENWQPSDMPSPSRIDGRFSELHLTQPGSGPKSDKRRYLAEGKDRVLGYVGMDASWPFVTNMGRELGVVDLKDSFSGLTFVEPYVKGRENPHEQGHSMALFVGAYLKFCRYIGVPETIVLDNGIDGGTDGGDLPQIVRHAFRMGSAVEFEPPGAPWKSGCIEKWHRDLQSHWRGIRGGVNSNEQGMMELRRWAQITNLSWPRKQLGGKVPATAVNYQAFPVAGPLCAVKPLEPIERGGFDKPGVLRFQRLVEKNGAVFLHGKDHFFVSDVLAGTYVRVTCLVEPGTGGGTVTVQAGDGGVVAMGTHCFDMPRQEGVPLVHGVTLVHFTGSPEWYPNLDQNAQNRRIERIGKRARPSVVYQVTGSTPDGKYKLRAR